MENQNILPNQNCDCNNEVKNSLMNYKNLKPIDHFLNVLIIVGFVSVIVTTSLLIFKKR
jgi:hypothetical protein